MYCLGQGAYLSVRLIRVPGASRAGLVELTGGNNARLVLCERGDLGAADEGSMRAKVADMRRNPCMLIRSFQSNPRLLEIGEIL